MIVSIILNALNEEQYLPRILDDIKKQDYDHKKIEVVLVNAMSTDSTKKIMEDFKAENEKEFYNVLIIDNIKKNQGVGMNLGIVNSSGDALLKVDAHATITKNFVTKNVEVIKSGEYVCGGIRPTLVDSNKSMAKTLHLVEENMFGSSIADYRKGSKNKYVKSVFHGMYRREVIDKCGLNDEQLLRTEDNEFNYRIRKNGYKIRFCKDILSYQYIRPTLKKMLKQKYGNGYWIGLTTHVHRKCLSIYHYVPFCFVISIIGTTCFIPISKLPIIALSSTYALVNIIVSILSIMKAKFEITHILMPVLMFLVHIAYGSGTLVGLIKGFSWKKEYYKNRRKK